MLSFLKYSEFDSFWQELTCLTPYGKSEAEGQQVYTERTVLEHIWDQTQQALDYLKGQEGNSVLTNRLNYHLKRISRFPASSQPVYDEVEIFEIKKFLFNYRAIGKLVSASLVEQFSLSFELQPLLDLLSQGKQGSEAFYVVDEYSPRLLELREKLRQVNQQIDRQRQNQLELLASQLALNFGSREFLVIPRTYLEQYPQAHTQLLIEPYDEQQLMVRPLPSAEILRLQQQREELLPQERHAEDQVLQQISEAIKDHFAELDLYRQRITAFDLALARARLASQYQLTRPQIADQADSDLVITKGRFIPCERNCQANNLPYQSLDLVIDTPATVLFGSNMGGKTITLKTIAFLQLCVQTGLYAPAQYYSTRLYKHFHYVGEGGWREVIQGLSGFGSEICEFRRAWQDFSEPTLTLFDEFARTTNSREAEALISAILRCIAKLSQLTVLFSTHFRGVCRLDEVNYLRMKGLNQDKLGQLNQLWANPVKADLHESLQMINKYMNYSLQKDDGQWLDSDAITIASLLGVNEQICQLAKQYLTIVKAQTPK